MRSYGFKRSEFFFIGYTDEVEYSAARGKLLDYMKHNLEHRDMAEAVFLSDLRRLCEEIFGKKELGISYRSTTLNEVLKKRSTDE